MHRQDYCKPFNSVLRDPCVGEDWFARVRLDFPVICNYLKYIIQIDPFVDRAQFPSLGMCRRFCLKRLNATDGDPRCVAGFNQGRAHASQSPRSSGLRKEGSSVMNKRCWRSTYVRSACLCQCQPKSVYLEKLIPI